MAKRIVEPLSSLICNLITRRNFASGTTKKPVQANAKIIKTLHKQNKELFGELHESTVEKLKRVKKEKKKLAKTKDENISGDKDIERQVHKNDVNSLKIGKLERLEEFKAAQLAEISWNMKHAQTRTKILGNKNLEVEQKNEKGQYRRISKKANMENSDGQFSNRDQLETKGNKSSTYSSIKQFTTTLECQDFISTGKIPSNDYDITTPSYSTDNHFESTPSLHSGKVSKGQGSNTGLREHVDVELTEDFFLLHGTEGLSAEDLFINFDEHQYANNDVDSEQISPMDILSFPFQNSTRSSNQDKQNPINDNILTIPYPTRIAGENKIPSVSTILNKTMPPEQAAILAKWEKNMIQKLGEDGFRAYKEGLFANGKEIHSNIQDYLSGKPMEEIMVGEAITGHWKSLQEILPNITHVHALESHVYHPKLNYCGIVDCVALYRDKLVVIDWKTSEKPKPFISKTYDAPVQIASYVGAINYDPNYSIKIKEGLIVVAYQDGKKSQIFNISEREIEKYWNLWLKRLQLYKSTPPT